MSEKQELRIRTLFRDNKEIFIGDIGPVGFVLHFYQEIIDIAKEYHITLMLHKPYYDNHIHNP